MGSQVTSSMETTVIKGSLTGGWSVLSRTTPLAEEPESTGELSEEVDNVSFMHLKRSGILAWSGAPPAVALRKVRTFL